MATTNHEISLQEAIDMTTLYRANRPSDFPICELIESKMNEILLKINQTHEIFEADKLHSELRILDWIFYQVSNNKR